MNSNETISYDLLIIGGGPAGMSAALVAGRCRLTTAIINAEKPRNRVTTASHGFLTRDGAHPLELLEIAKEQLKKYDAVTYINGWVQEVERREGFVVTLATGQRLHGKRLILATGFRDDLGAMKLPGLERVYGQSVYPCPFCDGYEHRDQRIALFGGDGVEHFAPLIQNWSDDVAVFTNGEELSPAVVEELALNGVSVHQERVAELISRDGILTGVQLENGELVPRDSGFLWFDAGRPANDFAERLGVGTKVSDWGGTMLDADEHGRTNVHGLYVVGDARTGFSGLMFAASEGGGCVEHIMHEITRERWRALEAAE